MTSHMPFRDGIAGLLQRQVGVRQMAALRSAGRKPALDCRCDDILTHCTPRTASDSLTSMPTIQQLSSLPGIQHLERVKPEMHPFGDDLAIDQLHIGTPFLRATLAGGNEQLADIGPAGRKIPVSKGSLPRPGTENPGVPVLPLCDVWHGTFAYEHHLRLGVATQDFVQTVQLDAKESHGKWLVDHETIVLNHRLFLFSDWSEFERLLGSRFEDALQRILLSRFLREEDVDPRDFCVEGTCWNNKCSFTHRLTGYQILGVGIIGKLIARETLRVYRKSNLGNLVEDVRYTIEFSLMMAVRGALELACRCTDEGTA